ncbi:DNA methyltransferase [Sphingomonas aracearum]|uniref:site-specific DNA-methyltransferase (adenine-specific) n=1 Tax=Sphingomonas aracearum TaxID=2283317 RepID=A0A369VR89_9SPHN|nr:DNA methyltransferase [Sphingomonas aracearum]RDE04896.1 site-specific DNA-methyltransferase [Sphingomonas aracearum]
MQNRPANHLYYGDNLTVLRREIADASVDLVYLDPPFNSNANYNILFKSPTGTRADAQIEAFEDTWHWNDAAEAAFDAVARSGNTKAFDLLNAMRAFLGENDMMAYLAMMAVRLLELHRVLKPTGSLYLHCDPTASHYLKLLLDGVFSADRFRSEVIWKRTSAHNSARRWGPIHDVILFYARSGDYRWNRTFQAYEEAYVDRYYRFRDDAGRRFRLSDLTASGTRNGESGQPWNGFDPTRHGRHWAIPGIIKEEFADAPVGLKTLGWLDLLNKHGLVTMSGDGIGWPHFKRYLDRMEGQSPQDIIDDIPPLSQRHAERLGYPTQKPLALLERIIAASSDEGDVVLDPFCGCGTAVHAAQKLGRQWIGIDVTHLAISLIEKRMKAAFPDASFTVEGTPRDLASAEDLARRDKYQFQWWAVSMVDAMPFGGRKKGADGGIDGIIYFRPDGRRTEKALVSVKGGDNVGVQMIRDLHSAMERERAPIGVFLTKALPSKPMEREAVAVGVFHSEATGRSYPRLQILTLAELFQGKKPDIPWVDGHAAFRRAAREESAHQGSLL